ncbi:hypothetical protein D9M68_790020 [compost metagenome]
MCTVVQQPAETQQHMPRTCRTHALLESPQRLATDTQRHRLLLFAVGSSPRTIEHPVTGGLQQTDSVVLAEFREALDCPLLSGQTLLGHFFGLEPVEVVREVDQGIGAGVVEQLGQAGGIPARLRRLRREETDVFLGAETDQRLPQGIAAT